MANNDHFVAQCHQRKFISDENDYIVYSKKFDKPNRKKGTKYIFSRQNLNSHITSQDELSRENEAIYKSLFEDNFDFYFKSLNQCIENKKTTTIPEDSVAFFLRFASAHILRNPFCLEITNKMLDQIANLPNRKPEFVQFMNKTQTAYSQKKIINYIQPNLDRQIQRVVNSFHPFSFDIFHCIESPFILPDCVVWFDKSITGGMDSITEIILPISKKLVITFSKNVSDQTLNNSIIKLKPSKNFSDFEIVQSINSKLWKASVEQFLISSIENLKYTPRSA